MNENIKVINEKNITELEKTRRAENCFNLAKKFLKGIENSYPFDNDCYMMQENILSMLKPENKHKSKTDLFITRYYGLDGRLPVTDREALKQEFQLNDERVDACIEDCKNIVLKRLSNKNFAKKLYQNIINHQIETYSFEGFKDSADRDEIMFTPMKDKKPYVGGVVNYLQDDSEEKEIAFVKSPGQYQTSMSLYKDGSWLVKVFNPMENYPLPEALYVDGKLYLGFYNDKKYYGRRYVFESGKNIIVEEYVRGVLKNTETTNIVFKHKLENLFKMKSLNKSKVSTTKDINKCETTFTTENNNNHSGLMSQMFNNGESIIGESSNGFFNGMTLRYSPEENAYTYRMDGIKHAEQFWNDCVITVSNANEYPKFTLEFRTFVEDEMDSMYKIEYDPYSTIDNLRIYSTSLDEFDEEVYNLSGIENVGTTIKKPTKIVTNGMAALNKMVGLSKVKEQIKRLKAYVHKNKDSGTLNLNMAFTGNPGTGKTEVARLLAKVLYEEGVLSSSKIVEVDRSGLVAPYIGQTEKKVKEAINEARGGVLFIDEAYALFSSDDDTKDFGKVAVDELTKAMEDNRGEMCFIYAGYPEPMEKMMNMNLGFKSRIGRTIEFEDYSSKELEKIAYKFLSDNKYLITDDAIKGVVDIASIKREEKNFDNARCIRNILETLYEIQAVRTYKELDDRTITIDDINTYKKDLKVKKDLRVKSNISLKDISSLRKKPYDKELDIKDMKLRTVGIKVYGEKDLMGEGTGFIISPKGVIATCAHVINGDFSKIKAIVNIETASSKVITKEYDCKIIDFDKKKDTGLIVIENPDMEFEYFRLKETGLDEELGKDSVMVGYPMGLSRFKDISYNEGKVQAYNTDSRVNDNVERIFLSIDGRPGNSGSAVLDKETKEVIGIFSGAALSFSGALVNEMNYAMPIDYLYSLLRKRSNKA